HLSRIELAVALRPAPAALPAKAPAPDAPITARPPALISAPRVVRPFETAFVSSSDIVSSGVRAMTLSFADVRTTRKDLQCAQLLSVGAMIRSVRTTAPGLRPRDAAATIVFEGRPIGCRPGDTVAAALLDAGELACRLTAAGDARGVFCGMGVCHECVVVVDGNPARSCMTAVRDGMTVQLLPALPSLRETGPV